MKDDSSIIINDVDASSGGNIVMSTDNTEKIRITNNGKIGIGRNNPDEKLRNRPLMGIIGLMDLIYEENNVWDDGKVMSIIFCTFKKGVTVFS